MIALQAQKAYDSSPTPERIGGKYGYMGTDHTIVIQPEFEAAWNFSDGLARVRLDGKCGYIDKSGTVVISTQFEMRGDFSEGLAAVILADDKGRLKGGYIDRLGNMAIPPRFDRNFNFHDGLAQVVIDRKIGYINKTGKYVWKPTK